MFKEKYVVIKLLIKSLQCNLCTPLPYLLPILYLRRVRHCSFITLFFVNFKSLSPLWFCIRATKRLPNVAQLFLAHRNATNIVSWKYFELEQVKFVFHLPIKIFLNYYIIVSNKISNCKNNLTVLCIWWYIHIIRNIILAKKSK